MKAAVLRNERFVIENMKKPELKTYGKGAIVKVLGCGLCGSDIVKLRTGKAKNGAVLGHEVVGEIVEINTDTDFETGNRIALGHHIPCFECSYCWNENFSMCKHFKETNIRPGGFSEYIFVSEEHLKNTVFNVEETLSDVEASFLEPLACCLRAVKRAGLRDSSKSLIVGLGSIGLLMGQALTATGHKAYGCDLLEERITRSERYNFEKSFSSANSGKFLKEISKHTENGFDAVFLTAGASQAVDLAVKAVRDGGTIVVFSSIKNENGFLNNDIYYRELKVIGSYSPSPMDLEDSMELIHSGKVYVGEISETYPVEQLNEAIADTLSNKIMKAYIKL